MRWVIGSGLKNGKICPSWGDGLGQCLAPAPTACAHADALCEESLAGKRVIQNQAENRTGSAFIRGLPASIFHDVFISGIKIALLDASARWR